MSLVGLVMWERRHAVRPELPSRTLCGIRTGMADVADVPGLTEFAGRGEGGLPACLRCLPMWRRMVALIGTIRDREVTGDNSTYRNVRLIIGGSAVAS